MVLYMAIAVHLTMAFLNGLKKSTLAIFPLVMGLASYGQSPEKYTVLPGGVEYLLVKDAPGTLTPANGDYVETNMHLAVDGRIIYNSLQANGGKPIGFMLSPSASKTDIQEVIRLMSAGDSVIVRLSVDSMIKAGSPKLDWMKPNTGQKAVYMVKMLNVRPMGKKETTGKK